MRNLITNGIKYSYKGGIIEISAIKKGVKTEISIRDYGKGMSEEVINNLFRIDIKSSEKGTNNEEGTGLGLILCHEFIKLHGGEIWVESEVGKGSLVVFRI
jgi:signal transduction histidine kinase